MDDMLMVLDPTGGVTGVTTELAERPRSFAGLVVGYLDNGKPNSDRFLELLDQQLAGQGARGVLWAHKTSTGKLADADTIADLAQRCDVVVTGVGDCAGCCSCTVQDGIALERLGTPTYVVCTTEMLTTAKIAATAAGAPDYPFTVIEHPLGSLTADLLAERAADAVKQVLAD
jgi:hypothetical protein